MYKYLQNTEILAGNKLNISNIEYNAKLSLLTPKKCTLWMLEKYFETH